ncbi:MAG TPA: ergothioneine biosynthesis protein EgtB [Frankiaceae bacterium]|nr:ergothioneine biosynthesis protein EgtB [Frankiaceae bacterium]
MTSVTATAPTTGLQALQELESARARTLALTAFDELELTRQHSPLMSPLVWDLAHIGQQEEHFLLHEVGWHQPAADPVFRPEIAALYDAFRHPRASRIQLPLLEATAAREHLVRVRGRVSELLTGNDPLAADWGPRGGAFIAALVTQHELQHIETMLATHQLRSGPPLLTGIALPPGRAVRGGIDDAVLIPDGPALIGADPEHEPGSLDNERPRHAVALGAFRIGRVPVTNAEWVEFIADGGYREPRWWDADGWEHCRRNQLQAPLFWSPDGAGSWTRKRFGAVEVVPPGEPVQHVDFHEAQAFSRWAGARLPTEQEWEKAAAGVPNQLVHRSWPWGQQAPGAHLANLGGAALRPAPVGAYPQGASAYGVQQLIGDVWEWTSSQLSPWPGFRPMVYDNYSAPFFGPDYRVLRGGSWATGPAAVRNSFRNWDLAVRRQIFSGLRLAWDA